MCKNGGCGNRACTCEDRAQPPAQSWNIDPRCSAGPYIDPILNQGSPTSGRGGRIGGWKIDGQREREKEKHSEVRYG